MVKHRVDTEKCRGCGKCVEMCGLELWILVIDAESKKYAQAIDEAVDVCHRCLACQDVCPEGAITVTQE